MCGLICYSGNFSKDNFLEGLSKISHRGPDDKGYFIDDAKFIGLGHTRLSIQDLSPNGHQPMISQCGNIVLIFNGEIYNFLELRKILEKKGHIFKSKSDTEVVLNLYIEMGIEMLENLNGIFSFIIYDKKKGELFISRDRFGIKPLYMYESDRGVAFSSEIKSLISLVPDEKEIDKKSIQKYINFLWCPGEGTPLKNIKKFPPGEAIIIRNKMVYKKWKYFQLPIFKSQNKEFNKNKLIKDTKFYLNQAVKRQLISDAPLGAFLSGGLDSSSIVALAKEQKKDLDCFTIEIAGQSNQEMIVDLPYAEKVAKYLDLNLDVISINPKKISEDFVEMIKRLDEPLSDPAAFHTQYICSLAKKRGMKVLLSGIGGDDLFTGYRRHQAINYEKYLTYFPKKSLKFLENISKRLNHRYSFNRKISKFFSGSNLDSNTRIIKYFSWINDAELQRLLSDDLKKSFSNEELYKPMKDFLIPLEDKTSIEKMISLDQRFFLTDHNLNYADKMSMSEGVEVRVPFLDNDLINFVEKIPIDYKLRQGQTKWILKKSMENLLPKEIIYRVKTGFGAPLRNWVINYFDDLINEFLSEQKVSERGLFDYKELRKIIRENKEGRIDASYSIFSILCIETWCRCFIDKQI